MKPIIPPKLNRGDGVRIIAPSCTLPTLTGLTPAMFETAKQWFTDRGLVVSEAAHLGEIDEFGSTTIEHRLADLHAAFADPDVHALMCIRGGWNCNQLLPYIDYDLVRKHPKILCGFSDITALGNAIFAKTGIVTYSGPNFNQFACGPELAYTHDFFEAAILRDDPIALRASKKWTNAGFVPGAPWKFQKNPGWRVLGSGKAQGTCIGGNLCTFSLLQGTEFMPHGIKDIILLVEDDHETHPRTFDRDLASLTQQPWFSQVRGVLIGRFEPEAVNTEFGPVTDLLLDRIIASNPRLSELPIIANVDFGHTHPMVTFPIGGIVRMEAAKEKSMIEIVRH